MTDNFRALVLDQREGKLTCNLRELADGALPQGNVTIAVEYSSLNYKDGLAVTGTGKIIRQFPMVPGIDLAGTVEHSSSDAWKPGDRVVLTGWGIGEKHWGGYTQRNRVKAEWLVRVPEALSTKQTMSIGTAGFTAMLSVLAIEHAGVRPGDGDVLVTGAAGGVGSVAVAILSSLGYKVVASTGRAETHEYLRGLGAVDIIDRATLSETSKKPLEAERWAGAVDSVGGVTLANVIKAGRTGACIAACGLAGGTDLATTVFPFILRGIALQGIDSVYCKVPLRERAWQRLASDLPLEKLERITQVIPLGAVEQYSHEILKGKVQGRVVVDVSA